MKKINLYYVNHADAGTTTKWYSSDSERMYNRNIKIKQRRSLLQKLNWLDVEIDYTFNQYGFRADEFEKDTDNIMFLGCSFTAGVGLPLENTWTHIVSTCLGLKNYNLGVPGSSNDTMFRMASYWILKLKPKYVVHMSTFPGRFEIFNLNDWPIPYSPETPRKLGREFYASNYNAQFNELKNKKAIKQLCNEANANYIELSIENNWQHVQDDLARDLGHPGVKSNQAVAEHVLKFIEEKNGN